MLNYIRYISGLLLVLFASSCSVSDKQIFNVLDYGAKNDGETLCTNNIQSAIDDCAKSGGGTVLIPSGDYLVGTINLKSHIHLELSNGARLIATTDLSQYQKHNDELAGVLYTEDAEDISVTGFGSIYGQGMKFMYPDSAKVISGPVLESTRQKENFRKVMKGIGDGPLYPKDRYHQMIIFSNCRNIELHDFKCIDSPYWCFLIVHCDGVTIDNIKIDNNLLIPNSDGIDLISSSNVNVSNCNISCGDDAIILAGYRWHFGDPGFKRIKSHVRNINVSNCILRSRSSAIRLGGWDENKMSDFNFNNITIYDSNRGINVNIRDSAGIENVNFNDITIKTRLHTGDWWGQGEPIVISTMLGKGTPPGPIRNFNFSNIECEGENSIYIYAGEGCTIENIRFSNFSFHLRQSNLDEVAGGNYDLRPSAYSDKDIFAADTPVIHVENAKNVIFRDGSISWDKNIKSPYFTYPIIGIDVDKLSIYDVSASQSPVFSSNQMCWLKNCRNVTQTR